MKPGNQGDFLGQGWAFPVAPKGGQIEMNSDEDNIDQSIRIILATSPGERVMEPDFGCTLSSLVFAGETGQMLHLAENAVERALKAFEPRIRVIDVVATTDPAVRTQINISVDYLVRAKNSRRNLVYPFYLET